MVDLLYNIPVDLFSTIFPVSRGEHLRPPVAAQAPHELGLCSTRQLTPTVHTFKALSRCMELPNCNIRTVFYYFTVTFESVLFAIFEICWCEGDPPFAAQGLTTANGLCPRVLAKGRQAVVLSYCT